MPIQYKSKFHTLSSSIFYLPAKKRHVIISMLLFIFSLISCKKYLDAKPDSKLAVPSTVSDLQGLIDNFNFMDIRYSEGTEIAADNYYLTDLDFVNIASDNSRDAYIWGKNAFSSASVNDWEVQYVVVNNANIVLDNIGKIERDNTNSISWDNCKGSALLFRGIAFYNIAQIWTNSYDSLTAAKDLGIPLRLNPDFNIPSIRSNLKDTYNQIISDLKTSIALLPKNPVHPYRPSKPAAYAFLSRVYIAIRDYNNALLYSDSCLQLKRDLCDFNNLDSTEFYPFASLQFTNPEDIMHTVTSPSNYNLYYPYSKVDTILLGQYGINDLRKIIYFSANPDGSYYFRGSYDGNYSNYNGVATDEMLLIRAECYARTGNLNLAMMDLNTLLIKRWKTGTFIPYTATNPSEGLSMILSERRKELVNRMLRLTDIKRLNKEGANISIKHVLQGQTFTLVPNDSRYALPIPENVIQLGNIVQNPGY